MNDTFIYLFIHLLINLFVSICALMFCAIVMGCYVIPRLLRYRLYLIALKIFIQINKNKSKSIILKLNLHAVQMHL